MKIKFKNINFKKIAALAICGTVFVTSGINLAHTVYDYKNAKVEYDELSELCTYELDDYIEVIEDNETILEENDNETIFDKLIEIFIPSALSEEKKVNQYVIDDSITSSVVDVNKIKLKGINWERLKEINSDIVGWIVQKDTVIDYPIVQGENNSFYLKNSFNKKKSSSGAIFLNAYNNSEFQDDVNYIYGHHMKNGEMFYSVNKYQKQYYYNNNKYMIIYTEDNIYLLEIFAGNKVKGNENVPIGNFNNEEEFNEFINKVFENSTFQSEIKVSYGDKILGLCTCTYEEANLRYIVYGKLVPLCKNLEKNNIGNNHLEKVLINKL